MNKKVEDFITKNYYKLLEIATKITKKDNETSRELFHEVILQLYQKDEIILKEYSDDCIKYYITSIMRVNYYSKTSPYHYRIRKERLNYSELSEAFNMEAEQEEFESELLLKILEEEYSELDWFRKAILNHYLVLNSLKAVSKKTTIPLTSISRYIKEGKEQIKTNVLKRLNED
jgi:DNA-directed RNA polymerase specialized sigma24 family protein